MVDGLTFIALAMSFFFVPFWSKIKNVYLCTEVNCFYISNAKLINLWETAVSLFVFLALLVEFSSDGGFSPPNPSVFSGIRLFILIYLKLQFYVELANPRHFVITACGRKFTA